MDKKFILCGYQNRQNIEHECYWIGASINRTHDLPTWIQASIVLNCTKYSMCSMNHASVYINISEVELSSVPLIVDYCYVNLICINLY